MKEITKKLHNKIIDDFMPMAEELRKAGKTDKEIQNIVLKHAELKSKNEYQKKHDLTPVGESLQLGLAKLAGAEPDSKAEWMLYEELSKKESQVKFHYQIGPYTADFLVGDNLVVELDGYQHQHTKEKDGKRDKYMKRLGYRVLRIPLEYFMMDKNAVVNSIIENK